VIRKEEIAIHNTLRLHKPHCPILRPDERTHSCSWDFKTVGRQPHRKTWSSKTNFPNLIHRSTAKKCSISKSYSRAYGRCPDRAKRGSSAAPFLNSGRPRTSLGACIVSEVMIKALICLRAPAADFQKTPPATAPSKPVPDLLGISPFWQTVVQGRGDASRRPPLSDCPDCGLHITRRCVRGIVQRDQHIPPERVLRAP